MAAPYIRTKKGALNLKFRNSQRKIKLYINFSETGSRRILYNLLISRDFSHLDTLKNGKRKPSSGCINRYHYSAVIPTGSLEHMANSQLLTRLGDGGLVIQALGHVKPRKTMLRKIKGTCTSPKWMLWCCLWSFKTCHVLRVTITYILSFFISWVKVRRVTFLIASLRYTKML